MAKEENVFNFDNVDIEQFIQEIWNLAGES